MVGFLYLTVLVAAFAVAATARPAPRTHTVHEKRGLVHPRWSNPLRVRSDSHLQVKIGLTQRNLQHAHDLLMDV